MEEKEQNSLAKALKKKKIRKYILIALAIALALYAVSLFSVESSDAKLADGQGNLPPASQEQVEADTPETEGPEAGEEQDTEKTPDADDAPDAEKAPDAEDFEGEEQTEEVTPEEAAVDNSKDFTASNKGNAALKPKEPEPVAVTLEIRCDTLSQNMDYLETPSIEEYIPEDGVILARSEYLGTTDNTVFDALNTLCRNNGIHLEFSFTPIYESYYIEGIGYLYEFDGGPASGWMYKVNDWFPNYGCSSYYLKDGDAIVWCYTCRGYGADVGDDTMNGLTEVKDDE